MSRLVYSPLLIWVLEARRGARRGDLSAAGRFRFGRLDQTLAGYTFSRRCLPIGLIGAAAALATAVCRRLAHACAARRRSERRRAQGDIQLGAEDTQWPREPQEPLFRSLFPGTLSTTHEPPAPHAVPEVSVRAGRPDLVALVRAAVRARLHESQRVVVLASGPAELVEAARKAVAVIRRECPVRLEFSGADPRW